MEHFRASRNQILFHAPTMMEVVITQYGQVLASEILVIHLT